MSIRVHAPLLFSSSLALVPAGYAGGSGPHSIPVQPNQTCTIGGTVSGLAGGQIVLQNNAGDNLTVTSNGPFAFGAPLTGGSFYFVSVLTQPSSPAQSCIVSNLQGSVFTSSVADIQVTCSALPSLPTPITTAATQWTWAGGSSIADQAGVYGTLGVPAVGNIPGARVGAVGWTDAPANFWLFGGAGLPDGG
ncbi:MAG TPA: hypothetical protein VME18_10275 [Acidobacteriaceae bacterium]|nr:hypothetical protein [Acidobacteriaceae bacterium]